MDTNTLKDQMMEKAKMYRTVAECVNDVKKVVDRFDGKMYNKRFDDAIRELSRDGLRFSSGIRYSSYEIYVYPDGKYNDTYTLVWGYSPKENVNEYMAYRKESILFTENKRIIGENMYQSLNRSRENLLSHAAELEASIEDVETKLKQVDELKNALQNTVKSLPSFVQDKCNLQKLCYL